MTPEEFFKVFKAFADTVYTQPTKSQWTIVTRWIAKVKPETVAAPIQVPNNEYRVYPPFHEDLVHPHSNPTVYD